MGCEAGDSNTTWIASRPPKSLSFVVVKGALETTVEAGLKRHAPYYRCKGALVAAVGLTLNSI